MRFDKTEVEEAHIYLAPIYDQMDKDHATVVEQFGNEEVKRCFPMQSDVLRSEINVFFEQSVEGVLISLAISVDKHVGDKPLSESLGVRIVASGLIDNSAYPKYLVHMLPSARAAIIPYLPFRRLSMAYEMIAGQYVATFWY